MAINKNVVDADHDTDHGLLATQIEALCAAMNDLSQMALTEPGTASNVRRIFDQTRRNLKVAGDSIRKSWRASRGEGTGMGDAGIWHLFIPLTSSSYDLDFASGHQQQDALESTHQSLRCSDGAAVGEARRAERKSQTREGATGIGSRR
jgi:hypothetical protein